MTETEQATNPEEWKPTQADILRAEKIADSKEPGTIRQRLLLTGWQQRSLFSGDYTFYTHDLKKVGITRKTIQDLLGSINDKFSQQLEYMLDQYPITILLLEGSWKMINPEDSRSRIISQRGIEYSTWEMVWNWLHRKQLKGVVIELTVNEGHTIQRLNELYALYQKPNSQSAKSKGFDDDRILALPSGTRGSTGMKVIDSLGSLQSVANASVADLREIKGIGENKANAIFNHFRKGSK
jgi:ERCC4-type nuclease